MEFYGQKWMTGAGVKPPTKQSRLFVEKGRQGTEVTLPTKQKPVMFSSHLDFLLCKNLYFYFLIKTFMSSFKDLNFPPLSP